jgi:hypothetical protein
MNNPAVLGSGGLWHFIVEQEENEHPALKDDLDGEARLRLRQFILILKQSEALENMPST